MTILQNWRQLPRLLMAYSYGIFFFFNTTCLQRISKKDQGSQAHHARRAKEISLLRISEIILSPFCFLDFVFISNCTSMTEHTSDEGSHLLRSSDCLAMLIMLNHVFLLLVFLVHLGILLRKEISLLYSHV